jgi:transcriptional regulator with XRE-family HTH domain
MTKLAELKQRLMDNPEVRKEYAKVDAEFALIEAMITARREAKLTQAELAEKIGTTQSAIARLEGGRVSPSISTLRRYAEATGHQLQIGFVQENFPAERRELVNHNTKGRSADGLVMPEADAPDNLSKWTIWS